MTGVQTCALPISLYRKPNRVEGEHLKQAAFHRGRADAHAGEIRLSQGFNAVNRMHYDLKHHHLEQSKAHYDAAKAYRAFIDSADGNVDRNRSEGKTYSEHFSNIKNLGTNMRARYRKYGLQTGHGITEYKPTRPTDDPFPEATVHVDNPRDFLPKHQVIFNEFNRRREALEAAPRSSLALA